MDLLVGAPSWRREWIILDWFDHVEKATLVAGVTPSYVMVLDTHDRATEVLLRRACVDRGRNLHVKWVNEDQDREEGRPRWDEARYRHMVWVRNILLREVRSLGSSAPFLSIDTDILLHEQALAGMLELTDQYDLVGGKCYMTPAGRWAPSYADLTGLGDLVREEASHVRAVDVVMAIVLMQPCVYNAVDYAFHRNGEDIGFCMASRAAGMRIGWDGRTVSKHVIDRVTLDQVDKRCGY